MHTTDFDPQIHDLRAYHAAAKDDMTLAELSAAGGKIDRVRIISERGQIEIGYIKGRLPDDSIVTVTNLPHVETWATFTSDLISWAKEQGVFAKGIGLLDRDKQSVFRSPY